MLRRVLAALGRGVVVLVLALSPLLLGTSASAVPAPTPTLEATPAPAPTPTLEATPAPAPTPDPVTSEPATSTVSGAVTLDDGQFGVIALGMSLLLLLSSATFVAQLRRP